jgi:hypothetical protein
MEGWGNGPLQIECAQKVTVHLQKVLEVTSTSVDTGLNRFNFIRKHFSEDLRSESRCAGPQTFALT